jgi:hypothetical protein
MTAAEIIASEATHNLWLSRFADLLNQQLICSELSRIGCSTRPAFRHPANRSASPGQER